MPRRAKTGADKAPSNKSDLCAALRAARLKAGGRGHLAKILEEELGVKVYVSTIASYEAGRFKPRSPWFAAIVVKWLESEGLC